jgi:HEAT repeat protein
MKRVVGLVGFLLLLVAGLGGGLWLGRYRQREAVEPRPGGQPAEVWLERLRSADPEEGRKAAEELAGLGEPGLTVLLEARKDSDIRAHRRAAAALVRLGPDAAGPLVKALRGGGRVEVILVRMGPPAIPALESALREKESAESAARVLGAMGRRARPAVAALAALLQDLRARDDARAAAAWALGQVGPENLDGPSEQLTVDPVIGALTAALSGPPAVRQAAALALGELGPASRSAIGSLARLSRDMDVEVARAACFALGQTRWRTAAEPLLARVQLADAASSAAASGLARLGPEARAAVPGLIGSLSSKKDDARLARAVLERLGVVAVPDLVDALQAPSAGARRVAAEVIGLMGPRSTAAVVALEGMLADREPAVVLAAAGARVRVDPGRSTAIVRAVTPLVLHPKEEIATTATLVLGELGPDAAAAAPVLVTALKARDGRVVARAASVLGRLRRPPAGVVAALTEALSSGPDKGRPTCAQALGLLGAASRPAVPALAAAQKEPAVRAHAALALVRIDPARGVDVARALTPDLDNASEPARSLALAALTQMRPPPVEVLPSVRALLADPQTARPALAVLAALDIQQRKALIPDLVTLLSSSDARLREAAGDVLFGMGDALPAVEAALKSGSPIVRASAARAWGKVVVLLRDPVPLVPLLGDPDPAVRQAAAETIANHDKASARTQEAMVALLARPEAELRRPAAWLLQRSSPRLRRWTPYLLECQFDPDAEVRRLAVLALHEDESAEVREMLHGLLGDPAPAVRLAAARQREARNEETTAVLTELARRAAPGDRAEVLRLLHRVDRTRAGVLVGELEADLRAEDLSDRLASAVALVDLDAGRAAAVLPLVIGILEGWDEAARVRAARALEALGARARPALPALRGRVDRDDSEAVRRAAETAMKAITAKEE